LRIIIGIVVALCASTLAWPGSTPVANAQIPDTLGCSGVTADWSGAAFDTRLNRLLIRGGGHNGYWGNEIYALNVDCVVSGTCTKMVRLYNSSRGNVGNCSFFPDGTPTGYHTYDQMEFMPTVNKMLEAQGSLVPNGGTCDYTLLLDLSALPLGGLQPSGDSQPTSAGLWTNFGKLTGYPSEFAGASFNRPLYWDPNRNVVWTRSTSSLNFFDPATNRWTVARSGLNAIADYHSGVVDPKRRLYVTFANENSNSTQLYWYDLTGADGYLEHAPTVSGCSAIFTKDFPGVVYDPVQDRVVIWGGGNTIYLLNTASWTCSSVTFAGGPTSIPAGTFGRFRYVPTHNIFVVCNSIDDNCYSLRLTPSSRDGVPPATPTQLQVR
jgi:hypothetical protein